MTKTSEPEGPPAPQERLEELRFLRFVAGGPEDPRPESNPVQRRLGRCMTCQGTVIAHWSLALRAWVDDSGRFHTGHFMEFPREWLA